MKILLIAAVAITVLACSSDQVASHARSSSFDAANSDEFGEYDVLNLRRNYKIHYHHYPSHHYPPVYPPQYIPPYQPPVYQPPQYPPPQYPLPQTPPPQYPPPQYPPPQYPPQYPPQKPPVYPTRNLTNGDCQICTKLVTYINKYGGGTAFSRNSALQNACNIVGTVNLAGCQHFVAIHGANLTHYLHPQSDPIGTCQIVHVC